VTKKTMISIYCRNSEEFNVRSRDLGNSPLTFDIFLPSNL
jgi:hypothetical protein